MGDTSQLQSNVVYMLLGGNPKWTSLYFTYMYTVTVVHRGESPNHAMCGN